MKIDLNENSTLAERFAARHPELQRLDLSGDEWWGEAKDVDAAVIYAASRLYDTTRDDLWTSSVLHVLDLSRRRQDPSDLAPDLRCVETTIGYIEMVGVNLFRMLSKLYQSLAVVALTTNESGGHPRGLFVEFLDYSAAEYRRTDSGWSLVRAGTLDGLHFPVLDSNWERAVEEGEWLPLYPDEDIPAL